MTRLRQRMIEDMEIRNLSPNTQLAYLQQVSSFAKYCQRSPEVVGPEEIRAYQVYVTNERKLAPGSLSIIASALRFLYKVTLKRAWVDTEIPLPKKPFILPVILSREEVAHFFESIASRKHRTILMTAYAAGLRVSEVTRLKLTDIDSQRMMIRVDQGKGRKDRYVMLSPQLLEILRAYWQAHPPQAVAVPGRYSRPAHHYGRGGSRLPKGPPRVGDQEADHAALAAARICHPPARSRHRCAQDPAADGSSQPGHHRSLFEGGHHHGVRDHQSLRLVAPARTHATAAHPAGLFLIAGGGRRAPRSGGRVPPLRARLPADARRVALPRAVARHERHRTLSHRRPRRPCRAMR